jgi:ent-kaurene oxidase
MFHQWIFGFRPSSWITHIYLRRAEKLLIPIIEERIKEQTSPSEGHEKPLDLLQYMIEGAESDGRQPERLAHLQLMVNLAGIHTTSMAITHAIHDLCAHEEYIKVLRDEIEEVLQEDGGWQRDTHNKLRKFDSFLKESQRFAPPTLCSSTLLTKVRHQG